MHIQVHSVLYSREDNGRTGGFLPDAILYEQMISKSVESQNSTGASLTSLSIFFCDIISDVTTRWIE